MAPETGSVVRAAATGIDAVSGGINRTSLTAYARQMQDPDENGARRMAARKWHEDGTIILLPDSIARLPWQDRELVQGIAGKIYGKREDQE